MPDTADRDDYNDLIQELASMKKDKDTLLKAVRTQAAKAAAAEHLGKEHVEVFAHQFERYLSASIGDDGTVVLRVTDAAGRGRTRLNPTTLKSEAITVAHLAEEFRERFAHVISPRADQDKGEKKKPPAENLTERMRAEKERDRIAAAAPFTAAERDSYRRRNPWMKATFNLTDQMRVAKKDLTFAAELEQQAGS
jgi:hypothetical protein